MRRFHASTRVLFISVALRHDFHKTGLLPAINTLITLLIGVITSITRSSRPFIGSPMQLQETLLLFALATPVQCYAGRRFHRAARRALERKSPNMDVLISTATCLAYGHLVKRYFFFWKTKGEVGWLSYNDLSPKQNLSPPKAVENSCQ